MTCGAMPRFLRNSIEPWPPHRPRGKSRTDFPGGLRLALLPQCGVRSRWTIMPRGRPRQACRYSSRLETFASKGPERRAEQNDRNKRENSADYSDHDDVAVAFAMS